MLSSICELALPILLLLLLLPAARGGRRACAGVVLFCAGCAADILSSVSLLLEWMDPEYEPELSVLGFYLFLFKMFRWIKRAVDQVDL